ncbi:peptidyl-prolyl cis-trans isomerase D [Gammaproteobacteria bacterium]
MLQQIRERAQGIFAWVIVILITIPFSLWGIGEYLRWGSEPVVAKVDGQEISQRDLEDRLRQYRARLQQHLEGGKLEMDDKMLRQEVLKDMVRTNVIQHATLNLGLRVGDDQVRDVIQKTAGFQQGGVFNRAQYDRYLQYQRLSSRGYEEGLRQTLGAGQLQTAVEVSEFATRREVDEALRLIHQRRDMAYFLASATLFRSDSAPDEAAMRRYYQDNADRFQSPEQVKLDYLVFSKAAVTATLAVTDEDLQHYYNEHKKEYTKPERRRASHILVQTAQDAPADTAQAALAKIEAAAKRIRGGEPFAVVAKEISEDPGSRDKGGDLGPFERGVMDPAFEQAAFALQKEAMSEPVRSRFGYHLIWLQDIEPATTKEFAEAKADLRPAYFKIEAERLFFDRQEKLANLVYENPDTLEVAAKALELSVQHSDWLIRSNTHPLLRQPKVMNAAFGEDVKQGRNSEVLEVTQDNEPQALVLRLKDYREAALKGFDEVRGEIAEILATEQARKKAHDTGTEWVRRIEQGETLDVIGKGQDIKRPGLVERKSPGIPPPLLTAAFRQPSPAPGKVSAGFVPLAEGGIIVYTLAAVVDGDPASAKAQDQETEQRTQVQERARGYYESLVENLRQRAKIEIMQTASGG